MSAIVSILFDEHEHIRLSNHSRWLIGEKDDEGRRVFTVYERKPYAKKTVVIISTSIEELAVEALRNES